MSEKPILFVSHSSKDGHIANVLKEQLEAVLDIEVFETSAPDTIEAGEKWFSEIIQNLDVAKAMLVLVSRNSRYSQWVHWETGYFYKKAKAKSHENALYIATMGDEQPFVTITSIQAKSLNNQNETYSLLNTMSRFFGKQNLRDNLREIANFISSETHIHVERMNTNPETQLMRNRLKDYVAAEVWKYIMDRDFNSGLARFTKTLFEPHKRTIFEGKYISYKYLDEEIGLPEGISKNWLIDIATTIYPLEVVEQDEYGVSFQAREEFYKRFG